MSYVITVGASALTIFLVLFAYGRWLEHRPERTQLGKAMVGKAEQVIADRIEPHLTKAFEAGYKQRMDEEAN